jgi:uncharacterized protein YhbP (UPF0306 family)
MPLRVVTEEFSGRVRRSALRILMENVLCSMSTVATGNQTHINTAYFCSSDDLELYFLSDPGSTHCENLAVNPSMAIAIFRSTQRWGGSDRGMQLFGVCREANGREAAQAERLYRKRFRLYAKWMAGTSEREKPLATDLRAYRFYRFVPRKVKILDEAEFGGGVLVTAALTRR